jgi:hypothetical protein
LAHGSGPVYPAIRSGSDVVGPTNFLTTAADLGRWLRNLLHGTVGGPNLRDRMRQPFTLPSGDTVAYAIGLVLGRYRGQATIGHGGAEHELCGSRPSSGVQQGTNLQPVGVVHGNDDFPFRLPSHDIPERFRHLIQRESSIDRWNDRARLA